MLEFIPVDFSIHNNLLRQLNEEHLFWIVQMEKEEYNIDVEHIIGRSMQEYVEICVKEFHNINPPNGIYFLLFFNKEAVGMGAIKKIDETTGEIKRMYIRPSFRGKGYGKNLLEKLLQKAKDFGFLSVRLDTSVYMKAAQKLYRSAGFQERNMYPETEVPLDMRTHWLYFEMLL